MWFPEVKASTLRVWNYEYEFKNAVCKKLLYFIFP